MCDESILCNCSYNINDIISNRCIDMSPINITEIIEFTNKNADSLKIKILEIEGKNYLDIRKYYLDGAKLKPTRKGIAMNLEQFNMMLRNLNEHADAIRKELE